LAICSVKHALFAECRNFLGILFLIPEEKFHVGSQLELQLEFRTSENTGVLLSVSEPDGYPALSLEINDGKVSSRYQTSNFYKCSNPESQ
jgi:hypothetical protein